MSQLIAIATTSDPYAKGLLSPDHQIGPILSATAELRPETLVLIKTPSSPSEKIQEIREALQESAPKVTVREAATDSLGIASLEQTIDAYRSENERSILLLYPGLDPESEAACLQYGLRHRLRVPLVRPGKNGALEEVFEHESRSDFLSAVSEPTAFLVEDLAEELDLIGRHPRFRLAITQAEAAAMHRYPILIHGELGSGKDSLALLIHRMATSGAVEALFEVITLQGLTTTSADSILNAKLRDLQSDNATLVLRGIEDLPLRSQETLVRDYASRDPERRPRLIATTGVSPRQLMSEARLREDLFFILTETTIELPPLRERRMDIPLVTVHLLGLLNRNQAKPRQLSRSALSFLQKQSWPGNLRDLYDALATAFRRTDAEVIEAGDIAYNLGVEQHYGGDENLPRFSEDFSIERYLSDLRVRIIKRALDLAENNQSEAARLLGISPQAVHKFIKTQTQRQIDEKHGMAESVA